MAEDREQQSQESVRRGICVRTVQITLDEELLASVDAAARKLKTTRSAFMRRALRKALNRLTIRELEKKHRRGYERQPVREGEFDVWQKEQTWGGLVKLSGSA